ncbi:C2 family cysteine protease [Scytonema sp. PCC 10023]|uniref:C2 family cysteine protease n=1 Tax=Scytonema sp. PCC 10023 TaxID=1680591 RepID=UPI0039C67CF0
MPIDYNSINLSPSANTNTTSKNQVFNGWLGHNNRIDDYSFTLSGRSSLNFAVDGLSADADLQLLDSNRSVIASSHNDRDSAESINTTLDAGTYSIQVYRVSSKRTFYNLNVSKNEAPQFLQFSTDKSSYQAGETVSLTNTRVFDGDRANDIARVDFWLQKDGGNSQDISDTVQFTPDSSDNRYSSFNYTLSGLGSGNYQLSAKAYDKSGASTDSVQTSFNIVLTQDWFELNVQDGVLRVESRNRFADGVLDRNDMIAILRQANDGSTVDATEITDLRTLVNNASYLQMPEYVRVLSNKVVNGDTANQKYQGNTLGNLNTGSSDIQMENLINKWFLGGDRPQTSYTYQYANGSLFQNGISYQDVKQGQINDCYFLTGLAATAVRSPGTIESMFIDNGDNTFTLRFWHNGVADYVTVDRYLPTNSLGYLAYANQGSDHNSSSNELWVAFAEKAYAQLNESGWIYQDNSNTYTGIGKGGYISDALAQITGKKTSLGNSLNFSSLVDAFNSGQLIGFGTKPTGVASNIVSGHAYALIDYNSSTQKFTLFNPWGVDTNSSKPGVLELSWSDIESSFSYWDSTIN